MYNHMIDTDTNIWVCCHS